MGSKGWRVRGLTQPVDRVFQLVMRVGLSLLIYLRQAFARNVNTHDVVAGDALDDLWAFRRRTATCWEESDSAETA